MVRKCLLNNKVLKNELKCEYLISSSEDEWERGKVGREDEQGNG